MKKHLFFSRTCIALFSFILIASCQKKVEPVSANFAAALEMNSSVLADSILQGVYVSASDTAAATYNLYLYSKAGSMQQTVMNSYNTG
ncbi:MAG TPA: hypothetical protein PL045_09185, partial [Chitinophagaceae bacterium]|nr:hypothetical protein [Chitinophagaceae bacterium]